MRIVLLGAGNVAGLAGASLRAAGGKIICVWSPSASAKILAKKFGCASAGSLKDIPKDADLYLIAVKDDAIKKIASTLRTSTGIVAHTSGFVPLSALKNASKNTAVIYPLQTISRQRTIRLKDVPVLVEASNRQTLSVIRKLAQKLSGNVIVLSSEKRKLVHLAAVISCNFTNHLYHLSEALLKKYRLPFSILRPLILETALKAVELGPGAAQTGPAVRGDRKVIAEHLRMLGKDSLARSIYKQLSASISHKAGNF